MLQTAIIANRTEDYPLETDEIRGLTEAAGARVLGEITQVRSEDPGLWLGEGKVDQLAEQVEATGADTVVVDGELTPQQTVNLEEETGASVIDRHRLVLEIFAQQARTRRAQLQVELARLRYRLPRVRERVDEGILNRWTESGTPYYDLLDRIDELDRKLKELPAIDEQHRAARSDEGFDLVAIAGYTNAGKTTLLRRLADDMRLEADHHADIDQTAGVEDRLFKTLETTTRRASIGNRDVLLTDTVGFLDDIPHWLVESFRGTLREVEAADAVVLVTDIAQPVPEIRRKLETAHETLGDDHPPLVTVMNKIDKVDPAERRDKTAALEDTLSNYVAVSALEGDLEDLQNAVVEILPSLEQGSVNLPLSDDAMSLNSWIHDKATAVDVNYTAEEMRIEFAAKPAIAAKIHSRAQAVSEVSAEETP